MDRCAPGLVWPGAASLFALLQRHSLLAGLDRGLAEAAMAARIWFAANRRCAPESRLLLLSLSGDGYPRCLFLSRDLCDSCRFVEPVPEKRESMEFCCELQVAGRVWMRQRTSRQKWPPAAFAPPWHSVASVRFQGIGARQTNIPRFLASFSCRVCLRFNSVLLVKFVAF
jgi:hypothetical protein